MSSKPVSLRKALPEADDGEEAALDPAVERIRQRLKRLILVSIITLIIGLGAVVIAVIYKIGRLDDKGVLAAAPGETTIADALPAGSHVVSSALDGRILALTYEEKGETHVVVIDLGTAHVLRRAVLAAEGPPAGR